MPEWGEIVSKVNLLISYIFTRFSLIFKVESLVPTIDPFCFYVYTKNSVIFYEMEGHNFWFTHTAQKRLIIETKPFSTQYDYFLNISITNSNSIS